MRWIFAACCVLACFVRCPAGEPDVDAVVSSGHRDPRAAADSRTAPAFHAGERGNWYIGVLHADPGDEQTPDAAPVESDESIETVGFDWNHSARRCDDVERCAPPSCAAPPPCAPRKQKAIPREAPPEARYLAPRPAGEIEGESNSLGLRLGRLRLPSIDIGLPTVQLPSLVRYRREPHMIIDPDTAELERQPAARVGLRAQPRKKDLPTNDDGKPREAPADDDEPAAPRRMPVRCAQSDADAVETLTSQVEQLQAAIAELKAQKPRGAGELDDPNWSNLDIEPANHQQPTRVIVPITAAAETRPQNDEPAQADEPHGLRKWVGWRPRTKQQ